MLDLIKQNATWIFSGIGVAILWALYYFFFPSKPKRVTNENNNSITINNNMAGAGGGGDKSHKEETELNRLKSLTNILFVDDDTKFQVVKILKTAGWKNTKLVKDIDNMDAEAVKNAHILFIDIQGVGKVLNCNGEGLGLALNLKKKYPEKKVIIYSAESKGDRFHEALRKVDTFLSKNAEPYEFQSIIEQYSAELMSYENTTS